MLNDSRNAASQVIRALRQQGFSAFLVGGCVRDRLMGRTVKDSDVATSAPPERVSAIFPNARLVGAHFGVSLVSVDGFDVEVATFRSDHSYRDGRRPEHVTWETDPKRDALRRDFTINGMMEDPDSGEILDYVGGRSDLANRVVRAIGDPLERFSEDHLRILRAIRFAARLGFSIEPATFDAMRLCAPEITRIAPERIYDELTRILTEGGAAQGFRLLEESGLLQLLLPELSAMKDVQQPPQFHPEGDVWVHTLLLLENLRQPSPTLAWGALLHDVGKPPTFRIADRIRFDGHAELGADMAEAILRRLRASNDEIEIVASLVRNHLRFKDAPRMKESTLKRFFRLPRFDEQLELHRLDCVSSHRRLENYEYVKEKWLTLSPSDLRPRPLLTGHDLIAAGLRPGPPFRKLLEHLEDLQLEGTVVTREQAVEWLRQVCSATSSEARRADGD